MRSALLLGIGLTFTALLLVFPALHGVVAFPSTALQWVAWTLPPVALFAVGLVPRPWLAMWLFPAAHLPALVLLPGLAGREVYRGVGGLGALIAIAAVGAAWCIVAMGRPVVSPRRASDAPPEVPRAARWRVFALAWLFPLGVLVIGLAVFAAFALAAVSSDAPDALAPNAAVLAGIAVVWLAVGRALVQDLGDVLLDPHARQRGLASLVAARRPRRGRLWSAFVQAAIAAAFAALWYGL